MKLFDCKKIFVTLKLDEKLQDNFQISVMVLILFILFLSIVSCVLFSQREFTLACMAQKSYLMNDEEWWIMSSSYTGTPSSSSDKCTPGGP